LPLEQLPAVTEAPVRAENSRRLVPDMHHAVLAAWIAAASILLPGCLLEEFLERRVMLVSDQVAGPFPAARVVGRVSPRRAHHVVALAPKELHVNRGRHQIEPFKQAAGVPELRMNF